MLFNTFVGFSLKFWTGIYIGINEIKLKTTNLFRDMKLSGAFLWTTYEIYLDNEKLTNIDSPKKA